MSFSIPKIYFKKHSNTIWIICAIVSYVIPLIFFLNKTYNGSFPFWYDPARDMLQAVENSRKLTLIGPPSGIPGLFYGPYWIWLLSLATRISMDPRVAVLVVGVIPYFTIFPFLLWKLRSQLGKYTILLVFLLFLLSFNHYATTLWNPHPAPLIFLGIITVLVSSKFLPLSKHSAGQLLLVGFLSGILTNFHISFGIGVIAGLFIYLTFLLIIHRISVLKKNSWTTIPTIYAVFALGIVIAFIPFILFEVRHEFLQTKTVINAFIQAVIYHAPVVGLKGLTKQEIVFNFVNTFSKIFKLPSVLGLVLFAGFICYTVFLGIKNELIRKDFYFLYALVCITSGILVIYLTSKNPVWEYHFFGVELLMLLLVAFVATRNKILTLSFYILSLGTIAYHLYDYSSSFVVDPTAYTSSYASTKQIVNYIYNDSRNRDFAVFAYSPSIYTYEFDYLFKWLGEEKYEKMPVNDSNKADTIYLIIPPAKKAVQEDFIEYKTPQAEYKTVSKKVFPDTTMVILRERLN